MGTNKVFRVNFYGFFEDFDKQDNFILDEIRKIGDVEISDNPDYVFYSVFDNEYLLHDKAVRIFFTGENVAPNFQLCDYAIGFERLDFGDRYLRYPFYYGMASYREDLVRAMSKHENIPEKATERAFCSFVYSNSDTDGMRQLLFDEMSTYKQVDSGGRFLNNMGGNRVQDKYKFERNHKFSIACENSTHLGYCTEKILQAFAAGTVPIYYGDSSVALDFNEKAFVNVHKFDSVAEAVRYVRFLDVNPDAYFQMLQEPAFVSGNYAKQMQEDFAQFIANIFEQDYESAFRRNRFFWGKNLDEKYKRMYKLEKLMKRIVRR